MIKYKTVKEIGKFTDEQMKTYDDIKNTSNKRSLTLLLFSFADLPIIYFVFFGSIIISSVLSWYFITETFVKTKLITINTYDFMFLFISIMCVCAISILVFLLGMYAIAIQQHKYNKKKNIDEIIVNED